MEAGPLPPRSPSGEMNELGEVQTQNLFLFSCGTYQFSEEGTVVSKLKAEGEALNRNCTVMHHCLSQRKKDGYHDLP